MNQKDHIRNAMRRIKFFGCSKVDCPACNKHINIKPLPILLFNKFIFAIQKKMVPSHFKNWLLSLTGLRIGFDACIPHDITFDPYFPELITIGAGSIVGGESTVIAHTFQDGRLIIGKVEFKPRTLMGGFSTLGPGGVISKNSILAMNSELYEAMPEGEIWSGKPAKCVKVLDEVAIEKYFGRPKGSPKKYYRSFMELVSRFRRDPSANFLKIQYNGSRLNAGSDWWRARSIVGIFWSGILVELQRQLPACALKNIMLRLAGARIGKGVRIGRNVILDHLMTWSIEIGNDVIIEHDAYIDGHSYTISQTIFGKIKIEDGSVIRHHALVEIGTCIGKGAVIEPYSSASRVVPSGEVWGGTPATFIKKRENFINS